MICEALASKPRSIDTCIAFISHESSSVPEETCDSLRFTSCKDVLHLLKIKYAESLWLSGQKQALEDGEVKVLCCGK